MNDKLFFCEVKGNKEETDMALEFFATLSFELNACTDVKQNFTASTHTYSESREEITSIKLILEDAIEAWKEFGLHFEKPIISTIKKEDWTEVWKKYFKIQHVTPTLTIRASWLEYKPKENETVIDIDPGMSFGTGSHETTQGCLIFLEKLSKIRPSGSFLDAGCGSGILSIAASKFGFDPICAFDHSEESIQITKENLKKNHVALGTINLRQADIKKYEPGRQFDVVTANIISSVLVAGHKNLLSWIAPGGPLILAGILRSDYEKVRRDFITDEVSEIKTFSEKEWTCGLFVRKKH